MPFEAAASGILAAGIVFGLYALGFLFLTTMFGFSDSEMTLVNLRPHADPE